MKFVDEIPQPGGNGRTTPETLTALRANRGRWAEIQRYPIAKATNAYSRASYTRKAHEDIECAPRTVGTEVVLYMRAVEQ